MSIPKAKIETARIVHDVPLKIGACREYPEDAECKSIAVRCAKCCSFDCWDGYLVWEERVCPQMFARRTR